MTVTDLATRENQNDLSQIPRENNKLRVEDRAAHNWYHFNLSFPAHLVRTYVDRFGLGPEHQVLDPFCGTGTTLVECKKLGIPSWGIEPNPMASFASRTKVDWEIDPKSLATHAAHIAQLALDNFASQGIEDECGLPLFESKPRIHPHLKMLPPDISKLLLTDSISPLPLHKTLVLLETLAENKDPRLTTATKEQLREEVVVLRWPGPTKLSGRPKQSDWKDGPIAELDQSETVIISPNRSSPSAKVALSEFPKSHTTP